MRMFVLTEIISVIAPLSIAIRYLHDAIADPLIAVATEHVRMHSSCKPHLNDVADNLSENIKSLN